ncbi:hypothetical protein B0G62_102401 [Paraburkholderia eburnea]|uniref:Rap1a immunity protein domain-containing protein n=1 Tax=Paraburkholderia eburnea TaxID=1189126 RepID=A0A2S4MJF5_9BURK|nr:hypothetical protein B0G62_102401 [Paraburkholderia eburnea]PRZ24610.1 hypothetical protein BX588_103329 [Paraburkholderia eburnea]
MLAPALFRSVAIVKKSLLASTALALVLCVGNAVAQTPPASPSAASIEQGDGFYAACQQEENLTACAMYLAGYSNGALVQALIDRQRPRYCLPPNLTRKDQLRVVLAYMKGHFELMLEPTGAIIYKAMLAAFPCK